MKNEAVQKYIEDSLQALAFWVGYQHQIYRHHILPEGAIVAELARMIDGIVKNGAQTHCERMYRELVNIGDWNNNERVDIALIEEKKDAHVLAMIEVKRASSPVKEFEADIAALSKFKMHNPGALTFVVVVSQAKRPRKWVNDKGVAIRKMMQTKLTDDQGLPFQYKVVRALKSGCSFKSIDRANFCCLIKV